MNFKKKAQDHDFDWISISAAGKVIIKILELVKINRANYSNPQTITRDFCWKSHVMLVCTTSIDYILNQLYPAALADDQSTFRIKPWTQYYDAIVNPGAANCPTIDELDAFAERYQGYQNGFFKRNPPPDPDELLSVLSNEDDFDDDDNNDNIGRNNNNNNPTNQRGGSSYLGNSGNRSRNNNSNSTNTGSSSRNNSNSNSNSSSNSSNSNSNKNTNDTVTTSVNNNNTRTNITKNYEIAPIGRRYKRTPTGEFDYRQQRICKYYLNNDGIVTDFDLNNFDIVEAILFNLEHGTYMNELITITNKLGKTNIGASKVWNVLDFVILTI